MRALLFAQIFAASAALATEQLPDVFRLENREYELSFLIESNALLSIYDFRKYSVPHLFPPSSACWRGYVAVWEVKDRVLHLTDLRETVDSKGNAMTNRLAELFPNCTNGVPADWFSGVLRLTLPGCDGAGVEKSRFVFSREVHVEVKDGRVLGFQEVDNTATVHQQSAEIERLQRSRARVQRDGSANGSQPIRSETNRTSSAAGSRR